MRPGGSSSSNKLDRNEIERNRRMQMKHLYSSLASLLPAQPSQERVPLLALLDQASNHVMQLKQNVEGLNRRKAMLLQLQGGQQEEGTSSSKVGPILPVLSVREMGLSLVVNLITGLNQNSSALQQIISVLGEEGAEVVSATYSNVGDKTFYTVHAQALHSRIGIETSRVRERLKSLAYFIT